MPIYEYEDVSTGRVQEMLRPVTRRDDCPPNLRRVMSRTGRPRMNKAGDFLDPKSADAAIPRALKQMEATLPASEIARQSGFSVNKLKEVWKVK